MVKRFLLIFFSYFALIAAATLGGMYLASKNIIGVGLVAILIVVVTVIPLIFMNKLVFSTSKQDKKILLRGVEAQAEITKVEETGITMNEIYYNIRLYLTVKPVDAPMFEVVTVSLFSRLDVPRAGDFLRVKYDPKDLTKVVVLTDANSDLGSGDKELEEKAMNMLKMVDERNKNIISYGVEAQATILKVNDFNIKVNGDNPLLGFELEISPEGKPKFFAKATAPVMKSSIGKYKEGCVITVKYDPNDYTKVSVFHS